MSKKVVLTLQAFVILYFLRLSLTYRNLEMTLTSIKKCQVRFCLNQDLHMNKRAIIFASRFIPKCTCLIQAMAFKVLSQKNIDLRLVIGIRNKTKFESHAWICLNGNIIFGDYEKNKIFIELTSI